MTAAEVYELTIRGGATDLTQVVAVCEASRPGCLIGGLAVNVYVEAVYTVDADLVAIASGLQGITEQLRVHGFIVEEHEHPVNAQRPGNDLRVQFTIDTRYQEFPERSAKAIVLGVAVRVACLTDTAQDKLWAYSNPERRFSKRKKDELDLIRLVEYPQLKAMYPSELLEQIDRG